MVDYQHPLIQGTIKNLTTPMFDEVEKAKILFEYVRDQIPHAWDIQSPLVTEKASEVIIEGTGICYAKSNLLAALLRGVGIPSGFCYQRLMLFDTPKRGYCLHAFNAAYFASINRWIVMDARGNKSGVDAQFTLNKPKLAFSVNQALGEITYDTIFHKPNIKTMETLQQATNSIEMYKHALPDTL